jgi:hypothetical protein
VRDQQQIPDPVRSALDEIVPLLVAGRMEDIQLEEGKSDLGVHLTVHYDGHTVEIEVDDLVVA